MSAGDMIIHLILSGILIVGVYQFYFFTQRYTLREVKVINSPVDEKFLSGLGGHGFIVFYIIQQFYILTGLFKTQDSLL